MLGIPDFKINFFFLVGGQKWLQKRAVQSLRRIDRFQKRTVQFLKRRTAMSYFSYKTTYYEAIFDIRPKRKEIVKTIKEYYTLCIVFFNRFNNINSFHFCRN